MLCAGSDQLHSSMDAQQTGQRDVESVFIPSFTHTAYSTCILCCTVAYANGDFLTKPFNSLSTVVQEDLTDIYKM